MKKKNISGKKLALKKVTIATINETQMDHILGGARPRSSKGRTCSATRCNCPSTVVSDKRVCG